MSRTLTLLALAFATVYTNVAADPPRTPSVARPATVASAFWADRARGWHFYEDPPLQHEEAIEPRVGPAPAPPVDPRPSELIALERLKRQVEDLRGIAVMAPTEANVRRYMSLENQVVRQASRFADVAQRVGWATPQLDMTLEGRPVNARAIEVYEREQQDLRAERLAALANTHVLLFFFRSDYPYCHAYAPVLERFAASHGLQIVPISVDGNGLPTFPTFRRDNGISRTLQVAQVPATFLAEPMNGRITPIGFGVLSASELMTRIATVTAPGAEVLPSDAAPTNVPPLPRQYPLN